MEIETSGGNYLASHISGYKLTLGNAAACPSEASCSSSAQARQPGRTVPEQVNRRCGQAPVDGADPTLVSVTFTAVISSAVTTSR